MRDLVTGILIGFLLCKFLSAILIKKEKPVEEKEPDWLPKEGEYSSIRVCVSCKEVLSDEAIYHRLGRCKHCGYKGPNAATVTDYKSLPVRFSRNLMAWVLEEEYTAKEE